MREWGYAELNSAMPFNGCIDFRGLMRTKIKEDIEKWQELFAKDGYGQYWVHTDNPGYFYARHDHQIDTAYVVLVGSMVVEIDGQPQVFNAGERFDVPKHVFHSAKIGSKGCTFLIGVRV